MISLDNHLDFHERIESLKLSPSKSKYLGIGSNTK